MRTLIYLAAAAVLFAACGHDSDETSTPTTVAVSASTGATAAPVPSVGPCPTAPSGTPSVDVFTGAATATALGQAVLSGVNVSSGVCSDTATFTFSGTGLPAYEIKYAQGVSNCGSGMPVTTAGPAQISLRFEPAVAHDESGNPTVALPSQALNLPSIKDVKTWCDFEAVVGWVIGTEERHYTVTEAQNPTRIVVEVYH